MASFFTKFARGASTAGATLFADQAMNKMKTDLAMKRDMMLEKNRVAAVTQAQEFQASESEKMRASLEGRQKVGIEATSSEAVLDRISLEFRQKTGIEATSAEGALSRISKALRQQKGFKASASEGVLNRVSLELRQEKGFKATSAEAVLKRVSEALRQQTGIEASASEAALGRIDAGTRQQVGIEASASEAALGRIDAGTRQQRGIEASASEAALNRIDRGRLQTERLAAQAETPQTKLATLQLNAAKNVAQLKKAYADAPNDQARFEAAKSMMAALGRPVEVSKSQMRPMEADVQNMIKAGIIKTAKEGYEKLLNPDDSFGLLLRVVKSLQVEQDDIMLPGDKKGIREILTEAQGIVDEFLNKGGDVVTGLTTIRSADVTDAERAGQQVNSRTGEVVILRNNKWHKVI